MGWETVFFWQCPSNLIGGRFWRWIIDFRFVYRASWLVRVAHFCDPFGHTFSTFCLLGSDAFVTFDYK